MKVRAKDLQEKQRIETLDALYTAAGTVRGRAAMKLFLRDLLTESERVMLGRRILIAQHLLGGKSYEDIAGDLKVGYDTIGRIHRWLRDQLPGYENAIRNMQAEFEGRKKRRYSSTTFQQLRKKYPGHFLFSPGSKN